MNHIIQTNNDENILLGGGNKCISLDLKLARDGLDLISIGRAIGPAYLYMCVRTITFKRNDL